MIVVALHADPGRANLSLVGLPASGNVLEVYLSPMMTNLFFNLRLDYLKRKLLLQN